jgi:hypothetical protein
MGTTCDFGACAVSAPDAPTPTSMARRVRRAALWALLLVIALSLALPVLVLFFSPRIEERLNQPVAVISTDDTTLKLDDGRRIGLPLIRRIPRHHPVFLEAVSQGVEVDEHGRVFGLLTFYSNGQAWTYQPSETRRINLSHLSVALRPECLDTSTLEEPEIKALEQVLSTSAENGHPLTHFFRYVQQIGQHLDRPAKIDLAQ